MATSNYVCAGFETLASILHNFVLNKKGYYDNHFTREDISKFFSLTCNKFLHSFGQNFRGKKNYDNYAKGEGNLFIKCRNTKFFDNSEFIVDSGGFQISIGLLDKRGTDILFNMYYKFLEDYYQHYDKAFILDVPPGPGCQVFSNFQEVYDFNLKSYMVAANMKEDVRNKIIYIHHFRTPKLWEIYTKILVDNEMFNKFKYHGTGGIVANMSSDTAIPCIIYVLPLIPLINQALKYNYKVLNFHILGGANYRDILFYELFKYHVLKKHGICLNITYDSSGLFKGIMVGRYLHIFDRDNESVRKLDIRSECLDKRFIGTKTIKDVYLESLNNLSTYYGFKKINIQEIYDPNTGTFHDEARVYSLLYALDLYAEVQTFLRVSTPSIYKEYEEQNLEEFSHKIELITRNINNEKITRKQVAKSASVSKSLDMLTNLDEDYCKHIVSKFLSKDEFIDLMGCGTMKI